MNMILCQKYRVLLTLFILCFITNIDAANVYKQARENIKTVKNLNQTITLLMTEVDKEETTNKKRVECYTLAAECTKKLHEAENMMLYLGQKYDTVKFYSNIADYIQFLYKADSIERVPDVKGKLLSSHAKDYKTNILRYRTNLLNGGLWSYKRQHKNDAYRYLDLYVCMAEHPLFSNEVSVQNDNQRSDYAYMAVVSAYSDNPKGVIKHSELAQNSTFNNSIIQVYTAKSFLQLNDSTQWLHTLKIGIQRYGSHPYFFTNLIDYYASREAYQEGLFLADSMLVVTDSVPMYWYAKSLMLLKLNNNREAINACDSCLHYDPEHIDASYNKGIASMNLALEYEAQACTDIHNPKCKRDREIIKSLYSLAQRPMEHVKAAQPDKPERWAPALYRIYLHLNMGKEFDEMDRLLQKLKISTDQ